MNMLPLYERRTFYTALLCTALLAGCGGGYGSGGGGGMGGCGTYGSCTPSVMVITPAGTVSGTVALTATASAVGTYTVVKVQFRIDGTAVGAADTTTPYSYNWDSTASPNGAHKISAVVTDSAGLTATSADVTVTVMNAVALAAKLAAAELFPTPVTAGGGDGMFTINQANGLVSGTVTLSGINATTVEFGDAYAGANSAPLFPLVRSGANANQWEVPAATQLDTAQRADFAAGKLYVLVRTAANPNGELRAQLLPAGFAVKFAALTGKAEVPAVNSDAVGQVAVTVDSTGLSAAVHVNLSGVSATGVELATADAASRGPTLAVLVVDANQANHFFNDSVALTNADRSDFTAGLWYANTYSIAHVRGELRGQIADPPLR